MSTRNRVLLGILLVFAAGVAWLLYGIISDLEPRYREAAEEPLDTTDLLVIEVRSVRSVKLPERAR